MIIDKNYEGITIDENGFYHIDKEIVSDETIDVKLDSLLIVRSINTDKNLIVECGIEAGDGIKAGWGIKAGDGIKAGWGIKAGTFISSKKRIFAGTSVYYTSDNCKKEIRCKELRSGEICYGDLILED